MAVSPPAELPATRLETRSDVTIQREDEQALAARFGIRSIPTLMIFRGGREVARQSGAMDAAGIVRWARSSG